MRGPGGPMRGGFMTEEEKANRPKVTLPLLKRIFSWLAPYKLQLALVLLPREDGWSFALSGSMDVRPAAQALCAAFGGKGGGPADMAQGVLAGGEPEALRAVLVRCAGESAP